MGYAGNFALVEGRHNLTVEVEIHSALSLEVEEVGENHNDLTFAAAGTEHQNTLADGYPHTLGCGLYKLRLQVRSRLPHQLEVVFSLYAQWAQGLLVLRDCRPWAQNWSTCHST
jgi:hypothetical protein